MKNNKTGNKLMKEAVFLFSLVVIFLLAYSSNSSMFNSDIYCPDKFICDQEDGCYDGTKYGNFVIVNKVDYKISKGTYYFFSAASDGGIENACSYKNENAQFIRIDLVIPAIPNIKSKSGGWDCCHIYYRYGCFGPNPKHCPFKPL